MDQVHFVAISCILGINEISLKQETRLKSHRDHRGAKFAGVAVNAGKIVVVEGDEEHLRQGHGTADQIEHHRANGESLRRLTPEIEHQLRTVFDQTEKRFHVTFI